MEDNSQNPLPLERLSAMLTAKEIEKLTQALATIRASGGWGDLIIRFKDGRVDTIEITSSILVRDKNNKQQI